MWASIDGVDYYFDDNGYLLVNATTPDGYMVGADGTVIDSTVSEPINTYDNGSYQSILDWYTQKIKEATPGLIAEYKAEAERNTSGLNGLAVLCNDKVSKLAEIEMDGVKEMAELYLRSGSGKYSEYEEWAEKLDAVYSDEAEKIWNAYMESAL